MAAKRPKVEDLDEIVGRVLLDKYRVDAILGHGAVGVVVACTHLALGERVAIKMLRESALRDDETVERFLREAQAAAKLKSEYVARLSDVGILDDGGPFMVMELLDGHDLGHVLEENGSLPAPSVVELTLQAADALAEAHSLAIVHRDIKPSNLFVTWLPDGSQQIKVLDFGISKSPVGAELRLTQTQSLLGTPAYMSPEQMRSARLVDSRTDIWSLGAVMYEALEGRLPYEASSFSEMCVKVCTEPPAPMQAAPIKLQQIVRRCLEKDPEDRYATMAELGRDLVRFAPDPHQAALLVDRMDRMVRRSQGHAVRTTPLGYASVPAARSSVEDVLPRAQRWHWFVLAAAAIVIGASSGIWVSGRGQPASAPASAAPSAPATPAIARPTATPIEPVDPVRTDTAPAPAAPPPVASSATVPVTETPAPVPAAPVSRTVVRHAKPVKPPASPARSGSPTHAAAAAPCNPYEHMDGC